MKTMIPARRAKNRVLNGAGWIPGALLLLVGAAANSTAQGAPPASARLAAAARDRIEVARLSFAEGGVEIQQPAGTWSAGAEGQALAVGDRVRTLVGGTARLEFPWTAIAAGDGSEVSVEKGRVLTLRLERGRLDIDPEQDLVRLVTAEASISGTGRTLVRREGGVTFVASYSGGAEVEAEGVRVRLGINKGTIIRVGSPPSEPAALGPAPVVVSPRTNPRYVKPGEPVRLTWNGSESAYHLEILSVDSDIPLMSLDVPSNQHDVRLNWLGTFRWRVAGRTGPVETEPSGEGLICVVEK